MPAKITRLIRQVPDSAVLRYIEKSFFVSLPEVKKIISYFHSEMRGGLAGRKSSLKMIPTYVDKPTGGEKGKFIALDLGGTNFRIVELELKGRGRLACAKEKKFIIEKKYTSANARVFFDFLAGCLKRFCKEEKIRPWEQRKIGFTFSFPVKQTGISRGSLIRWTKDFSVKNVQGKDVVRLFKEALVRKGLDNMRIAALVNDAVGTLASAAYEDENCDVAIILGTGTNACYQESMKEIIKWQGQKFGIDSMIINIEWGNFNKLRQTLYDRLLDALSDNPGYQLLEKMVSGMYLGEIARIILRDLARRGIILSGRMPDILNTPKEFKSEYISRIEADGSKDLSGVKSFLYGKKIYHTSLKERKIIRKVCQVVSARSARLSAASGAAVITKIDRGLRKKHTIAIDGSLYEKHPVFARNMRVCLRQIFGGKAARIKIVLAKDGSGRGAAIIASLTATFDEDDF